MCLVVDILVLVFEPFSHMLNLGHVNEREREERLTLFVCTVKNGQALKDLMSR